MICSNLIIRTVGLGSKGGTSLMIPLIWSLNSLNYKFLLFHILMTILVIPKSMTRASRHSELLYNHLGWIKTFERYYSEQTKLILDNMVKKLSAEPKMKFIYAEMSFFERWWQDIDDSKRKSVKELGYLHLS